MSTATTQRKRSAPGADKYKGNGKFNNGPQKFNKNNNGQYRNTKPEPKGKSAPKEEQAVRRKKPVTQGGGSEEEIEDEGSDDDEMEVDGAEEGEAQGESGEPPEKRPKMSKAEKAALHAAQPHRTSLLPSHPLLHGTLLPLWETARKSDLGKEERKVAVKELWDAVKGRVGEVSRGHKGGRVLQTVSIVEMVSDLV